MKKKTEAENVAATEELVQTPAEIRESAAEDLIDEPYQPCNGDEGEWFMNKFCYQCEADAKFQITQDGEDSCPIVPLTMAYNPGDAKYPTEWVTNNHAGPRCTAFVQLVEDGNCAAATENASPEFHQEGSLDLPLEDATGKDAETIIDDLSKAGPQAFVGDFEFGKTFTRELPVTLPDHQLAEYAQEMARIHSTWVKTKLDAKAYAKGAKNLTDKCEEDEIRLAEIINAGAEERPVLVQWLYDYTHGIKRLIRNDTNEIVEEATLTVEDRQGDWIGKTKASIEAVEQCLGEGVKLDAGDDNTNESDTQALGDDNNITEGNSERLEDSTDKEETNELDPFKIPGSADSPDELAEAARLRAIEDNDKDWPL